MAVLSTAYALLVVILSIVAVVAVWRVHKERIRGDLRRVARALRLRR